jgi:DNA-binding transcriptional regulator YhcF (GntR family)
MDKINAQNKFAVVPEWVIELDISHTAFRLYAVLARYADNVTHQAFPSLDTLSNRLGCSEKTVRRAIEDLVKHGAIKKHSRGRYQSSLYTVITSTSKRTKVSSDGTKMSEEGTKVSTRSDKNDHLTRTTELEPVEREPLNNISESFDDFWNVYPRKQGKGKAREAFMKAVKTAGLEAVMSGARRYASDPNLPDPKFVPLPTTWLNQERWDDGPLPLNRSLTNSERNIQSFRESMAILRQDKKEVESNEQSGNESVVDFGVNLRSADSV